MRRFYYGPKSGISTDSLSYTQVREYPQQSVYLSLFSREAQICPEPLGLYIRMQDIVIVRDLDGLIFRFFSPFWVCLHAGPPDVTSIVESLLDEVKFSFAYNCQFCNTDAHIEIRQFDSNAQLDR